jgi:hypothetical protein
VRSLQRTQHKVQSICMQHVIKSYKPETAAAMTRRNSQASFVYECSLIIQCVTANLKCALGCVNAAGLADIPANIGTAR